MTGTAIPNGATALSATPTSFTISEAATLVATETITVSAWTNVERTVTTFVVDENDNALSSTDMTTLQNWLGTLREVSFVSLVAAPQLTPATVAQNVQNALLAWLNPGSWGDPTNDGSWLNSAQGYNVGRYLKAVGITEAADARIDYCSALTLGFDAEPTGSIDISMNDGQWVYLPTSSTASISVTATSADGSVTASV